MSIENILFSSVSSAASSTWLVKIFLSIALLTAAGRPIALTLGVPCRLFIVAPIVGLGIVILIGAFPVAFSKFNITVVLAAAAATNLFFWRSSGETPPLQRSSLIGVAIFAIVFLGTAAQSEYFMHYDYFHANMRSLELARSGSVSSVWYQKFDEAGWYLIDQTSSIVLDALEIVWSNANTGVFSKLYAVLLASWLIVAVGQSCGARATILLAIALSIYMFDLIFSFRPHIYVGLCLSLLAVQVVQQERGFAVASGIALVSLILAKRDGLILAPLSSLALLLFVIPYRKTKFVYLIVGGVVSIAMLLFGLFFAQIGGRSVGLQLLSSLSAVQIGSLLQRPPVWMLALLVSSSIAAYLFSSRELRQKLVFPFILLLVTSALILSSALLLEGADRFNAGTMVRKIVYFLCPLMLTFLAFLMPVDCQGPKFDFRKNFALPLMIGLTAFVGFQLRDILWPRKFWGPPAVAAVEFFRSVVPDSSLSIGVLAPKPTDLALTPFGDVEAYRYPLMTAFLGRDLLFAERLSEVVDRDVVLLPSALSVPDRMSFQAESGLSYREFEGGYGALLSSRGLTGTATPLRLARRDGTAIDHPLERLPWDSVVKRWSKEFKVEEKLWPNQIKEVAIAWPSSPSSWSTPFSLSFSNSSSVYVHRLEFRSHPFDVHKPKSIAVRVDGKTYEASADSYYRHGRYVVPIEARGDFTVDFLGDTSVLHRNWNTPYFVIFDFKILQYQSSGVQ